MNFRPELAMLVMAGRKTVTRRLTSPNPRAHWSADGCFYRVGRDYAVCPGRAKHAIGRATVTEVRLEQLGRLTDDEARREGFVDAATFERAFAAINGAYDPDVEVWRVALRAVRESCPVCGDDGWVDVVDEETGGVLCARECERLGEPGHAPFNATGLLERPPDPFPLIGAAA